jgi:hypothetical protein
LSSCQQSAHDEKILDNNGRLIDSNKATIEQKGILQDIFGGATNSRIKDRDKTKVQAENLTNGNTDGRCFR